MNPGIGNSEVCLSQGLVNHENASHSDLKLWQRGSKMGLLYVANLGLLKLGEWDQSLREKLGPERRELVDPGKLCNSFEFNKPI